MHSRESCAASGWSNLLRLSWLIVPLLGSTPALQAQDVDVFTPATLKTVKAPKYPEKERRQGEEGWVHLNYMVSPDGKAYEVTVIESVGSPAFRQAAINAVESWEYEPATYRGQGIDAGRFQTIGFALEGGKPGATLPFVRKYRAIGKQIQTGTREAIRAGIDSLAPKNLYEDAFLALLEYRYAGRFGDEHAQLHWLRRALMREVDQNGNRSHYVSSDLLIGMYANLLSLEAQLHHFGSALDTAQALLAMNIDADRRQSLEKMIGRLTALASGDDAFAVSGAITAANNWNYKLLKDQFDIQVESGELAEFKLRCDRKYVGVRFDAELEYTIAPDAGQCWIEVIGNPGSRFKLTQY